MVRNTVLGHYAVHARRLATPLLDDGRARWLWQHLRDAFPDALSCTLMPDHPHLVMPLDRRRKLAAVLGAFARQFGLGALWEPVLEPQPLTSCDKIQRALRYNALNPCRPTTLAGRQVVLTNDPLAWPWSTHCDVVGLVAEPWVTRERVQQALGWSPDDFRARYHKYVSSDPHVDVSGTPLPQPSFRGTLEDVAEAALHATRSGWSALRRRSAARTTFIALAYRCGWNRPRELAPLCNIHPDTVPRTAARCPDGWLDAAARCLGSPLVRGPTSPMPIFGRERAYVPARMSARPTFGAEPAQKW